MSSERFHWRHILIGYALGGATIAAVCVATLTSVILFPDIIPAVRGALGYEVKPEIFPSSEARQPLGGTPRYWEPIDLYESSRLRGVAGAVGQVIVTWKRGDVRVVGKCTGVIVDKRTVLSAAHCLKPQTQIFERNPFDGRDNSHRIDTIEFVLDYDSELSDPSRHLRFALEIVEPGNPSVDYAVFKTLGESDPSGIRGKVPLVEERMTPPRLSEPLNLIHHPQGKAKQVTRYRCRTTGLKPIDEQKHRRRRWVPRPVEHSCDSDFASSGGAVFLADDNVLIGVHVEADLGLKPTETMKYFTAISDIVHVSPTIRDIVVRDRPELQTRYGKPAPVDVAAALRVLLTPTVGRPSGYLTLVEFKSAQGSIYCNGIRMNRTDLLVPHHCAAADALGSPAVDATIQFVGLPQQSEEIATLPPNVVHYATLDERASAELNFAVMPSREIGTFVDGVRATYGDDAVSELALRQDAPRAGDSVFLQHFGVTRTMQTLPCIVTSVSGVHVFYDCGEPLMSIGATGGVVVDGQGLGVAMHLGAQPQETQGEDQKETQYGLSLAELERAWRKNPHWDGLAFSQRH